jgi:capsular exopolysaccharide synthesis family protein
MLSPDPTLDTRQGVQTDSERIVPQALRLWTTIRKHWVAVAVITAIATVTMTFYTLGKTRIFRSNVTLQIEPSPPRPLGQDVQAVVDIGSGAYWNNLEYYQTQFKIIQSRRVAEETVRRLGLNRDGAFVANLPPGRTAPPTQISTELAAGLVRSRLLVEPVKDSRLVVVGFEDADPERAQRIVSTLADVYIELNIQDVVDSTISAGDWLRAQLDKLKVELESSEHALHEYKKKNEILSVSLDDQSNLLLGEMRQLSARLTDVRSDVEHLRARYAELSKIKGDQPGSIPSGELATSGLMSTLEEQYVEAQHDYDAILGSGKQVEHPDAKAAAAKLATIKAALLAEFQNVRNGVAGSLAAAEREAGGLSGLFEGAKKKAMDLNLLEIEYRRLERAKSNTEKVYSMVLEKSKESDLVRLMRFNNIRVVDAALVSKTPVSPRVPVNIGIGVVGGLLLGLAFALGRELLDRSLKTPVDMERELNLPFLGLMPAIAEGGSSGYGRYGKRTRRSKRRARDQKQEPQVNELIVHSNSNSGVAEAARAIRTNIMFMSPDTPPRRLVVTSASPSEGKTTVACCIAVAMSQTGQRVLLIDCDLRRPRLHRIFGRTNEVGVSNAILDRSILDHADLRTEVPNLDVLPSGPLAPSPAELVQSDRFGELIEELSKRYDRLILDSPPVVPVTDAAILAHHVDGTVLVVRAFETKRELAKQAARILNDVGGRILGTVLNAVDLNRKEYISYYYYNQYYGSGQTEGTASPPAS